mmetsp:Transcript_56443/g.129209  ORF Transcript_56443/g.129209 Transcript_56443/m.129209 type:complete len:236 (-) Transcript_56443:169-876(-)
MVMELVPSVHRSVISRNSGNVASPEDVSRHPGSRDVFSWFPVLTALERSSGRRGPPLSLGISSRSIRDSSIFETLRCGSISSSYHVGALQSRRYTRRMAYSLSRTAIWIGVERSQLLSSMSSLERGSGWRLVPTMAVKPVHRHSSIASWLTPSGGRPMVAATSATSALWRVYRLHALRKFSKRRTGSEPPCPSGWCEAISKKQVAACPYVHALWNRRASRKNFRKLSSGIPVSSR